MFICNCINKSVGCGIFYLCTVMLFLILKNKITEANINVIPLANDTGKLRLIIP